MRGARDRIVDSVLAKLNDRLHPVALLTNIHPYEVDYYQPDESVQNGDIIKDVVIVHQKQAHTKSLLQRLKQIFNCN